MPYFNKRKQYLLQEERKTDKKIIYWLKNEEKNKYLSKRFQRTELFALINNFAV